MVLRYGIRGGGKERGPDLLPSELMGALLSQIVFVLILDSLMMMMMVRPAVEIRRRRRTVSWRRCVECGQGYLLRGALSLFIATRITAFIAHLHNRLV